MGFNSAFKGLIATFDALTLHLKFFTSFKRTHLMTLFCMHQHNMVAYVYIAWFNDAQKKHNKTVNKSMKPQY